MNKTDLIGLGLSEELAEKVIISHGRDIESIKARSASLQAEADALKGQLAEAGNVIEGFKKLDVDGIKSAADEWKAKAEQARSEAQAQIAELKFSHALESALVGAKAKNVKTVQALLNKDALSLSEDGSISGLSEQLEQIKSQNDYLFEDVNPAPRIVAGGNSKSVLGDPVADAARKAAGLLPTSSI
jgi:hypothetical protein